MHSEAASLDVGKAFKVDVGLRRMSGSAEAEDTCSKQNSGVDPINVGRDPMGEPVQI